MATLREPPRMELRGLKRRGGIRAAVLVVQGASGADLDRACDLACMQVDSCMLVAVDGGLRTCLAKHRRPDLYVGDGDSAGEVPSDIPAVVFPRDKDFSDLAGALGEMRQRRVQIVSVAGLLGGRIDHEWANLLELGSRARGFAGILAPTARGLIVVTSHGCRAATVRRRTVSLFSLGGASVVSLHGTRWELERQRLRPGSQGLSNVTGTELDLVVHSGSVGLVFLPPRGRPRRRPQGER